MHEEVFSQYLQFEKRYSRHTVTSYLHDVANFFSFIAEQFSISDPGLVRHTHVRAYVVRLVQERQSPATIRQHLSALKTFFRFCQKHHWVERNPAQRVVTPKLPSRLPKFIEQSNLTQLLENNDAFPSGWEGVRDRLMLEFFYGTGMRRNELLQLCWKDIDFGNNTIKIHGKGNKQRLVPLAPSLAELLKNYKQETTGHFPALLIESVILTDKGGSSYDNFIYRTVKKYLSLCSTQPKKSPHVLRHAFATHISNNGAKLNDVKELLGHASLASTQVYTHNSIEQLREIYKLAHPKA
jgi:integrase/recombinase XerC